LVSGSIFSGDWLLADFEEFFFIFWWVVSGWFVSGWFVLFVE
jgi:hypothetical protein